MSVRHISTHALRADLVANAGVARLVLCGPFPPTAPMFRHVLEAATPPGWSNRFPQAEASGQCEGSYTGPNGERVRVTSAASWFGRETRDPSAVVGLFRRLEYHLQQAFKLNEEERLPFVTPASTGGLLWRLTPGADAYPELSAEDQELIRATCGQGREEILTLPTVQHVQGLHYWDLRWAYPSMMEKLPVGPVRRDRESTVPPGPGRLRVQFQAPANWAHVGILPVKREGGLRYLLEGEGWADACEVRFALAQGWRVEILERMLFDEGRPLDTWSRRLLGLMQRMEDLGHPELTGAVRKICLAGFADMHGRGRMTPVQSVSLTGRSQTLQVRQARREERPSHPEWTAAVWARCRYRLTKLMLTVPRESLLGAYIDGVFLSEEPGWPDLGRETRPGAMRAKAKIYGEKDAPRSFADLRRIREQHVEEE